MRTRNRFSFLFSLLLIAAACGPALHGCASLGQSDSAKNEAPALEPGREPIVLVCQIDTMVPDENVSHISYALAPLLRRDLFCVQEISVIPTTDTDAPMKAYFLNRNGLRKLAHAHGADVVTVGLLKGDSEKITLEFEAFDVVGNRPVFKTTIEEKISALPKLQKKLTYGLIEGLGIALTKEEQERLAIGQPRKSAAIIAYGRGLKQARQENHAEALIAYRDASTSDSSFGAPYAAEAKVFQSMNAPLRALQSYETALAKDRYYAEAWYQLNIYTAQYKKRDDLAMDFCRQALEVAPRYGKAHLSLGTRLHDLGNLDGAIEETKTAAELLRVDPLPRYNLGVYYLESGDPEQARAWFERALKIDPGFELARIGLLNMPKK